MTSTDLRVLLILKGLTASGIARDLGVSRAMVSLVITGVSATPWIRRHIAERVGIPYILLWGEPDLGVDHLQVGRPRKSKLLDAPSPSPRRQGAG